MPDRKMVDPNYATTSGPYYSPKIFVEENAKSIQQRLCGSFKAFVMLDNDKLVGTQ